jgi:transcriptional regulator with XRE-family HTH domain
MPAATIGRLDNEAVFEALDKERRRRRMTRAAVCAEIGVTGATYCSWGYGGGISGSTLARIAQWLDVDIRGFVREEDTVT